MAKLRSGDWVELKSQHSGCRCGRVVSADDRTVALQTDATDELGCMRFEVTGPLTPFDSPHPYFPMKKKLPYGCYNCADDSYVLFNRDYEPLYRVQFDGTYSACGSKEPIKHVSKCFFYVEGREPWRNRDVFDYSVSQLPPDCQLQS